LAFYIGGMDTTGHLCGMIIYFLTQNKNIKDKLLQEIYANNDDSMGAL
jgi:hypothetical protein